jgi:hypothetical protein
MLHTLSAFKTITKVAFCALAFQLSLVVGHARSKVGALLFFDGDRFAGFRASVYLGAVRARQCLSNWQFTRFIRQNTATFRRLNALTS